MKTIQTTMKPNTRKRMQFAAMTVLTTGASTVMAAVPTEVTTAIETAGTDAVSVGTAVFVVIVGIFAIKLLRRAL